MSQSDTPPPRPSLSELAARASAAPPSTPAPAPAVSSSFGDDEIGTWRPISRQPVVQDDPLSPVAARPAQRPAASHASQALIKKVADLGNTRLAEALREMFSQADDTLYKFAEQASGTPNQEFLVAFKLLRQHHQSLEKDFRAAVDRNWQLEDKKQASALSSLGELSLVGDEELEESLAENVAVAHADKLMAPQAVALRRRLAIMLGRDDSDQPENPLGAKEISAAFKDAMQGAVELPSIAKMIVFKLFDRHVLAVLPDILAEINTSLADAGILPDLRPAIVRAPVGNTSAGGTHYPGNPSSGGMVYPGNPSNPGAGGLSLAPHPGQEAMPYPVNPSNPGWAGYDPGYMPQPVHPHPEMAGAHPVGHGGGGMVPWSTVQSLLAAHRPPVPMVMGAGGIQVPAPVVPLNELVMAIERLNASVDHLDHSEPLAFKKMLAQFLETRPGRDQQTPETLGAHEDVIDMIDLLFDFILKDSNLPSPIQTMLVRLQMPFLRIAVTEPGLFAEMDHPARVLLNTLSEAGKGWTEESDRKGELRDLIKNIVERVIEGSDQGSALCKNLTLEFVEKWEAMKKRSQAVEKRNAEANAGKEKLEAARAASAKAIVGALAGVPLPDKLRMAVHRAWAHHMTLVALKEGAESRAFRRATDVLDTMASLTRLSARDASSTERKTEIELLVEDWRKGLLASGLETNEVSSWVALLVEFCNERLGFQAAVAPAPRQEHLSQMRHEDIATLAPKPEQVEPQAASSDAVAVVASLTNGTWVEWKDRGIRAKLAWVGGFTGKLMFVDIRGNKAVETHKNTLAREIEQGVAIVLSDAPLMDQAVDAIGQKLSSGQVP